VCGLSATGKSALISAISEASSTPADLVRFEHDATAVIPVADTAEATLEAVIRGASEGALLVVDEVSQALLNKVSELINRAKCWFLIINRTLPASVHVSVRSVCHLSMMNNIHTLTTIYAEDQLNNPKEQVICEGGGGEVDFYRHFAPDESKVGFVDGNGAIMAELLTTIAVKPLVIADGASLGHLLPDLLKQRIMKPFLLYLPESFEWVLLLSDFFDNDAQVRELTSNIEDVVTYRQPSIERYLTSILSDRMVRRCGDVYDKGELPSFLYDSNDTLDEQMMSTIWQRIAKLDFSQLGSRDSPKMPKKRKKRVLPMVAAFIHNSTGERIGLRLYIEGSSCRDIEPIPHKARFWNLAISNGVPRGVFCGVDDFPILMRGQNDSYIAKRSIGWVVGEHEDGSLKILSASGQVKEFVPMASAVSAHKGYPFANAELVDGLLVGKNGMTFDRIR